MTSSLDITDEQTESERPRVWRVLLASAGLLAVLIPLVAFGLGAAISSLTSNTLETALRRNAAETARNWANYFASRFDGFERVLETGALTTGQRKFIASARQVGQVYRFKLYDVRGRLVIVSDAPQDINSDPARRSHDVHAVQVVQTGRGVVTLDPADRKIGDPLLQAAAYVPVNSSTGEPLGVVAVYIDQTVTRNALAEGFQGLGLKLTLIAVAVFLIPAIGFAWRNVQEFRRAYDVADEINQSEAEIDRLTADRERLGLRLAAVEKQLEGRTRELGEARRKDGSHVFPLSFETIRFDDWLVQEIETQVEALPAGVDVECRLSLGDLDVDCDLAALRTVFSQMLGEAAAAFDGPRGQADSCLVISTRHTHRGIELAVAARGGGRAAGTDLAEAVRIIERHGGGIDVLQHPEQGVSLVAWWPEHHAALKAA